MSPVTTSSPSPPPVGTYIDNGTLQLVEILGYGGYGIVYRAIPTMYSTANPPSYAVKCLPAKRPSSSTLSRHRTRDPHLHETHLHTLASSPPHPNIITLHKSVVDPISQHTYIIMDLAPGGDLFTQILHKRAFLGHGERIRNVFLQLIEAVERCHDRGVYHRDLKPENILCWDTDEDVKARRRNSQEMRVALTDFGLATRDIWSKEFRTGSVYHMSPECHGPASPSSSLTSTATSTLAGYSPAHSDLFSLGIILLNLITGRNPWKSASPTDPTFQAYCREPQTFLMSVLPISREVNDALVGSFSGRDASGGLLSLNPSQRLPGGFEGLKRRISSIREFYSPDVVFEGGMARCGWEVESGPAPEEESDDEDEHGSFVRGPEEPEQHEEDVQVEEVDPAKLEAWQTEPQVDTAAWQGSSPTSHWSSSTDGDSEMVFAPHHRPAQLSWVPTPLTPRSQTPTSVHFTISRSRSSRPLVFSRPSPSSSGSEYSSGTPEPPVTPPATSMAGRVRLRLDTNLGTGAGVGSGFEQNLTPASRTTLVSRSPYTLRSGVSPFATHAVTRSPFARIQPNSPFDSTTMLMGRDGDEIEEEMRTAIEMENMGFWMGSDDELIPIPMPLSAKSPLDQQPLPIPRRDAGYGDSFYDSSTDSSEDESEDDVRMSLARSFGPEEGMTDVGMEFTYTYSEYEYSYSTPDEAVENTTQDHRMSVISTTTTIATGVAIGEDPSRMSIVATTPTSAIPNENRMSIIPSIPTPTDGDITVPPARPESPILGLSFLPLPSSSAQPVSMPEPSQPIPIPAPTIRDGSYRYHEAEARREAATYSFLTTDPALANVDGTSSFTAPSFSLSAYPSSSCAPTSRTLNRDSGLTLTDESWSFFTSTDLDLDFKLTSPTSPAPLPIRPPPSPPIHYPALSRSSRSRSRRPSRKPRERTIERKSRAVAASAAGPSTAATRDDKGNSVRRTASSFLSLSLSSMGLGGFKKSREPSPAPPASSATTANGTKPPPPTPSSSNPSTQTQTPQIHGQFSTHWTLSTSISICTAREQGRGRGAGEVRRRRRLRSPLRGWFSPA
ncbi:unnamed protein product [Somion occarium]|uniref:Protein kinase domain-containing protein n=1 Tax=Somion occarium TaxID=3059160 RepID=A0ABP1CUS1_9APHY